MKILIVTSSIARFPGDPLAAHGNTILELLTEIGRHVEGTVLAPAQPDAIPLQLGGLDLRWVQPERPTAALHQVLRGPGLVRVLRIGSALARAAREVAPAHDVAHGLWAYPAGRAVVGLGMPSVVTFPGSDIHAFARVPVIGRMVRRVARTADAAVAVDTRGREILTELRGEPADMISSPIKIENVPLTALPSEPTIAYVGRLSKEKGADVLLDAVLAAREAIPQIRCTIAGDGPERARLEQRCEALGLSDSVTFAGALSHADAIRLIVTSRALVLPSRREGLPSSALESLAAGRPVVATEVGGLPDLLARRMGVIVKREDPRALALGIVKALYERWDPATLRARAEDFQVGAAAQRYVGLYSHLLRQAQEREESVCAVA